MTWGQNQVKASWLDLIDLSWLIMDSKALIGLVVFATIALLMECNGGPIGESRPTWPTQGPLRPLKPTEATPPGRLTAEEKAQFRELIQANQPNVLLYFSVVLFVFLCDALYLNV